ncbi:MAG: endonuclease domain-containing protein [Pseudomonadota bacterium]
MARRLRKAAPLAERLLWAELRKLHRNIRRQAPIGPYVADFAHHASRLVIEIDGYAHGLPEVQARDAIRTAWLEARGYRVVRVPERDVHHDLPRVVELIERLVCCPPSPLEGEGSGMGGTSATSRPAGPAPLPTSPPSRGRGQACPAGPNSRPNSPHRGTSDDTNTDSPPC